MFFDERLNFIAESSSLIRVSQQGDGATPLVLGNIRAPRNGYAYVYVSNESNEPVFFDDLKVQHRRSALLEETHYYPFGLAMAGISSKKLGDINEGRLKNQYQYQGAYAEYDDETSWNDFELRSYDAQIGRFIQADPYDQFASPYTGMGNDPVNLVDPSGGSAIPCPGSISALSGIMSQVSTMTMILGVTSNALQITSTVTAQQTVMSVGSGASLGQDDDIVNVNTKTREVVVTETDDDYDIVSIDSKKPFKEAKGEAEKRYRKQGYRVMHAYGVGTRVSDLGSAVMLGWAVRTIYAVTSYSLKLLRHKKERPIAEQKNKAFSEDVEKIGNGHAWDKHKVNQDEFPEINSREEFKSLIDYVMNSSKSLYRKLSRGREAWYDPANNTLVIKDPTSKDGGTIFRPVDKIKYFNEQLR